jgi:hypothetical protein
LEDLFHALPLLKGNWALEIRGQTNADARDWLEKQIPSACRGAVQIEPPVPPDALGDIIARCDIGLALDPPWCRNKNLTVSNKLLHYLQAGLTVVAADTEGVREVKAALPEAVHTYTAGQPAALAERINRAIGDRQALGSRRDWISRTANQRFGYEHQALRLLAGVDRALTNRTGRKAVTRT